MAIEDRSEDGTNAAFLVANPEMPAWKYSRMAYLVMKKTVRKLDGPKAEDLFGELMLSHKPRTFTPDSGDDSSPMGHGIRNQGNLKVQ